MPMTRRGAVEILVEIAGARFVYRSVHRPGIIWPHHIKRHNLLKINALFAVKRV